MEELSKGIVFTLGYLVILLCSVVTGQDGDGGAHSSPARNRASYFNSSLGSSVTLSSAVLSMRSHIAFSFRTCSYGRLIHQRGANGDYLSIALTENGSLEMSWFKSDLNLTNSVLIGNNSLRNNKWYTTDSNFVNGEIHLSIEAGSRTLHEQLISNSTYQKELWDLDLSGGVLQVGAGFTGCIQEGPGIQLSADDAVDTNVEWGSCPLEYRPTEGCEDPINNPCWRYPCQNGGTCTNTGEDYRCTCPVPYRGRDCEDDLGDQACDLTPCQNGGTCTAVSGGTRKYECSCIQGYTGVNCEIDIDECASQPCRNDGLCVNQANGYKCNCSGTGYEGDSCESNINECLVSNPCQNGATCMDNPGNFKCSCPVGFGGDTCEDGLDECQSNPCRNGGTCSDELGYYLCTCPEGFTGTNCEVNIDDCEGITCTVPFTQCVDGINSFSCQCLPGYAEASGNPGNATICVEVDECGSNPCQNGATCQNEVNAFSCICPPGYSGDRCGEDIDECAAQPCLNGAQCADDVASYTCTCLLGFSDDQCSTNIDECQSNPCQNGATCNDHVNGYNCSCTGGWSGRHCEVPINECLSDPCQNGGVCYDEANGFRCDCLDGFAGSLCETNIDDCADGPCLNRGRCVDGVNQYTCECPDAWMGRNCTMKYDACSMEPCNNNASCKSTPPSHEFICSCQDGFEGNFCENNIDDCVGHSCSDFQVCVDGINEHSCECPRGYTGPDCTVEIDECASDPCQNGGTCLDGVGNYTCICVGETLNLTEYSRDSRSVFRVGYDGPNCEIEIDECEYKPPICLNGGKCDSEANNEYSFQCFCPNGGDYYAGRFCHIKQGYCNIVQVPDQPVCHNGGSCHEVPGKEDYYCSCAPGFTGERCKTNIDECESNPCLYNGTCVDGVNGYTCSCAPGLTGIHCETNIDECNSFPCQNGGMCDDIINGYLCNCSNTGFEGTHCQNNIDDCASNPCANLGTCEDKVKGFECKCHQGYEGSHCEIDINECASNPCQNDATCWERSNRTRQDFNIQQAYGYDCDCVAGYTGVNCQININECESNPCINGNCKDLINEYQCVCNEGWTGINCDEEVDECETLQPCLNGATCLDKLADYQCTCAAEDQGMIYGGKNCTTELTGCEGNGCQNGATCVPFLVNEQTDSHDYKCTCPPGFVGKLCEKITTASFYGDSWLKYAETEGRADIEVSLRFRTTLPGGVFVVNYGKQEGDYMVVQLVNGTHLEVIYSNALSTARDSVSTPDEVSLNDGNWVAVALTVTYQAVAISLTHPTCPENTCSSYIPISVSGDSTPYRHHTLGVTYFGMYGAEGGTLPALTSYIGCLEDMVVDGTTLVPRDYVGDNQVSANLVEGCPRTDQCNPDPCNSNGECHDLWHNFKCDCSRPFIGESCDDSFKPATFGFENQISYAQYDIPDAERDSLKNINDLTVFFRTRKENGLIFYLGGDEGGPLENQTFISTDLMDSSLRTRVKLSDTIETFMFEGEFADGEQHFLNVKRENERLRVMVNEALEDFTVEMSYDLHPEHLYLGGMPSRNRRKRQADDPSVSFPVDAEPYKGTLQDARQNGQRMPFFSQNVTEEEPPAYDLPTMQNVISGEVSDDVCNMSNPCVNNGTCSNVFFNDFSCDCPDGYRGKNCSELDFCMYVTCPGGATCNNLDDGFECVAPSTFNGGDTAFTYSHTLNPDKGVTSISLKLRSRQESGSVFRLESADGTNFVNVEFISGGRLSCSYDLGVESQLLSDQGVDLLNGDWQDVSLHFEPDAVRMMVNQTESSTNSAQSVTLDSLLAAGKVTVGKTTKDSFKGCLDEVRIGGVLLPFFARSEIVNNTAAEQFYVETQQSTAVGCVGDPVCDTHQCENGATCVDVWNKYECDCSLGFNGTLCENNIDDCVGHDCENGATCVDGIANFTCECVPGYVGERCETDVDECSSDPCLNNGTCQDVVNGFLCNCTENYYGDVCEIDLRENCANDPCQNNATCNSVDTKYENVTTFNCSCVPGFTGERCESEIDYCEGDPCQNNATCISDRSILSYTCSCLTGYTGYDCETEIDECESFPCQNGGTCVDQVGRFECDCAQGFRGEVCEEDINECNETQPCENGLCIDLPGGFLCNCTGSGYRGDNCSEEIDECEEDEPCLNGGECTNTPGSYTCNCTLGYTGNNCETPDCDQGQCKNGATCSTTPENTWQCSCVEFHEGDQCEIVGACVGGPCQNGGTCSQSGLEFQDYKCNCTSGWTGQNCTEDIDECEIPDICNSNGNCTNFDGGHECSCFEGFTGTACETEIDYCPSDPCQNSGVCSEVPGGPGFICDCSGTGFNGSTCEDNIDECKEDEPCKNGATCEDLEPFYRCLCTEEYVGQNCTIVNPCNGSYCQNDAGCDYEITPDQRNATATCNCTSEWEGPRCETTTAPIEAEPQNLIPLVVGVIVAGFIVVIVIVVIVLVISARNKRATRGTYSPSRQEMSGSRVEMGNVLKPPPEERLI